MIRSQSPRSGARGRIVLGLSPLGSGRLWSGLVVLPARAGGDGRLVGCARLCQDDDQPIAMQCIRPAGHEDQCRRVSQQLLVDAEGIRSA